MQRRPSLDLILKTPEGRFRLGWRLLLFVLVTIIGGGALALVLPANPLYGSVALLLGSVGSGALLLAMDGRGAGALGFYLGRSSLTESALGLLLGTAIALAVVAVIFAVGGVRWAGQEGSALGWLWAGLGALAFLAVPAAAEEALLRGYPLQALAERWGAGAALGVTALVFGALHRANPGVTWIGTLNVAVAGVFLGVVYLRTGSLWWATGAHLGWNWAHGFLADVPVSGLELLDAPLYEGAMRGPAWLGGGGFGPEGSIVSTVLLAAISAWCWHTTWLRPSEAALKTRPLALIERASS